MDNVGLCMSSYSCLHVPFCVPPRLHFPFSLVVSPRDPLPGMGGRNQILPAWVLAQSPYTVRSTRRYPITNMITHMIERHILNDRYGGLAGVCSVHIRELR